MIVVNETWANIPLLHIYDESMTVETPTVFFLHGHLSASEHNLHYAYQLINKGVRVIMPDALYHGRRYNNESEIELTIKFWDIILSSITEVGILYEEGLKREVFLSNSVGLAGTSMGGVTTSACLAKYDWISAAAICMGVTNVKNLAEHQLNTIQINGQNLPLNNEQKVEMLNFLERFNLENKHDVFNKVPIIFWHGAKDSIVPISCSYPYYEQNLKNSLVTFIKDDAAAHAVTRTGMLQVTAFLAHHLSEQVIF